jgi:hypothetical protein
MAPGVVWCQNFEIKIPKGKPFKTGFSRFCCLKSLRSGFHGLKMILSYPGSKVLVAWEIGQNQCMYVCVFIDLNKHTSY